VPCLNDGRVPLACSHILSIHLALSLQKQWVTIGGLAYLPPQHTIRGPHGGLRFGLSPLKEKSIGGCFKRLMTRMAGERVPYMCSRIPSIQLPSLEELWIGKLVALLLPQHIIKSRQGVLRFGSSHNNGHQLLGASRD
jgi:hypothetical protein